MKIALKYLNYLLNAVDEHSLHSPLMFEFYTTVVKPDKNYYYFSKIEEIRKGLVHNQAFIDIEDFGAGSRVSTTKKRTIGSIAKKGLTSARFSRLLFRIASFVKPATILELGTSLGINTLYLSYHNPHSQVITFEGSTSIAALAQKLFNQENRENIKLVEGNIDETLQQQINLINKVDLVYFDANHRFLPTLNYFEICLSRAHKDSIFIFDDIHWSEEMEKAWKEIKSHPKVSLTADVFDCGIVFFKPQTNKQHYILQF